MQNSITILAAIVATSSAVQISGKYLKPPTRAAGDIERNDLTIMDDGEISEDRIGIVLAQSSVPTRCIEGFKWDSELCICVSMKQCRRLCPEGLLGHPVDNCSCLTQKEYDSVINYGCGN